MSEYPESMEKQAREEICTFFYRILAFNFEIVLSQLNTQLGEEIIKEKIDNLFAESKKAIEKAGAYYMAELITHRELANYIEVIETMIYKKFYRKEMQINCENWLDVIKKPA